MRGLVTSGLLVLLAAGTSEAQPTAASGDGAGAARGRGPPRRGRGLPGVAAGRRACPASPFSSRIYCDVSNLERQVRASGNPPELFVLRREVSERPCLGLYWGLFASRDEARARRLQGPGGACGPPARRRSPCRRSCLPGEPAPPRVATAPPAPVAGPRARRRPTVVPRRAASRRPSRRHWRRPRRPFAPAAGASPEPEDGPAPMPQAPSARVPALEIAAGYAYLHDDSFPGERRRLRDRLDPLGAARTSTGASASSARRARSTAADDRWTDRARRSRWTSASSALHAGLRYAHRGSGLATPYVQGLAGVTRSSVELAGRREVEDDFSIQPGAGVVFRLSDGVGLGLGGDYRLVFGEVDQRNEFRLHADLVFGIGSR